MFVHVETRNGRAKFQYTISTPYSTSADAIDPNLPTVLWFHPFAFPYVFHPQFSDPLLRQFNLVAFSFRAHGETEGDILPECYGVPEATEDALAFMDAVNLPECHFVAMDYGSSIALRIAMSHPNRVISLFIISQTCIEEPRETLEGHQQLYDTWVASLPSPTEVDEERAMEAGFGFAQLMFSNKMSSLGRTMFNIVHPMAQKNWGYYGLQNFRIAYIESLRNRRSPSIKALSRIRCPIKLVYGTDDIAYPRSYTEDFLRLLKKAGVDASLLIVRGAPHFVSVDFADRLNPVIHAFIKKNDSRRVPPVFDEFFSPWESIYRAVRWGPEGSDRDDDSDDDSDIMITYPPGLYPSTMTSM